MIRNTAQSLEGPSAAPTSTQFKFGEIPGRYATRDGREVEIHERRDGSYFPIKGSVRIINRHGKLHHLSYNIWTDDGRNMPVGESRLDIVGVWQPKL